MFKFHNHKLLDRFKYAIGRIDLHAGHSCMSEISAPRTKSRNFCLPIQRGLNPSTIRFARAATYAMFFGDGLGFGVWAGHIPIFKQKFHLGDAQLSIALFAVALGAIFSMPIVGHSVRRFGSRSLTGLCAIVIAGLALAPSFPLFVLGTTLLGACKGSLDVSINAQAVAVESAYGRQIMSSFQAAWSVGGLVEAALAGRLCTVGSPPKRISPQQACSSWRLPSCTCVI
jgi:MFS family permease